MASAIALVAAATTVAAQGMMPVRGRGTLPCVLDKCLGGASGEPPFSKVPEPSGTPAPSASETTSFGLPQRGTVAPGAFDFYVLSLSWSPGFCETIGAAQGRSQCEPGTELGFVVHGLWPQNAHGYPSNCDAAGRAPPRMAIEDAATIYPDEALARHEWRMHGTCTGLSPTDYFAAVRLARRSIRIPPAFEGPHDQQTWQPLEIARAFTAVNPRLRTDTMAVTCRANMLEDVRLCFSKDLRGFVSCPEVARASCRRPIEVLPVM